MKNRKKSDFTKAIYTSLEVPVYFSNSLRMAYINKLKIEFAQFSNKLKQYHEDFFEPCLKSDICFQVEAIQKGILKTIDIFLEGHPASAYDLFKEVISSLPSWEETLSQLIVKVEKNNIFFRARNVPYDSRNTSILKNIKALKLFHPPFHKRHLVGPNRFSISGYPCLYLSQNLETSLSECLENRTDNESFNAIGLKNMRPLYFIDLSGNYFWINNNYFNGIMPNQKKISKIDISSLLNSLPLYQLVIACQTKINYDKKERNYFKPEYIIPQIMLQLLKEKGNLIDGIKYSSCTAKEKFPSLKKTYNYVIPVKETKANGFCPSLVRVFQISEVLSFSINKKEKGMLRKIKQKSAKICTSNYSFLK